jgi:hypothetical protein
MVMADGFAWNGQTYQPLRSRGLPRAPVGTVRASLASGTRRIDRQRRLGHEGSLGQTGSLRDLYEGLH